MQLIIYLDEHGLQSVTIHANPDEHEQVHDLYRALESSLQGLGTAVKNVWCRIESTDSEVP
jgi:hypothetical protein